jgi:hypothetical protein
MKTAKPISKFLVLLTLGLSLTACSFGSSSSASGSSSLGGESSPDDSSVTSEPTSDEPTSSETPINKGNKYYFDSNATSNGDGTISSPYKELSSLSSLSLEPNDSVLFKCGSRYLSSLSLSSLSGSSDASITFASYGDGNKPVFDGNGLEGSAVLDINNCNYVTVKGLEITDSVSTEGDRRGVLIHAGNKSAKKLTTFTSIKIDDLYIHDIRGITDSENSGMSTASKKTGGVHIWADDEYATFDGVEIVNCTIENVDNVGIASWSTSRSSGGKASPYDDSFKSYAFSNVHIAGNHISNIGKNAIFARNLYGGVIENNVIKDTAMRCVSGNTIVTSYVYGTIIQHNEGSYNRAIARKDGTIQDGCMLDADLQSRDTIWQYNYSHDNAFGLFLNCTTYVPDSGILDKATVRYNLSVNDKGGKGIIYINYVTAGISIYNNTFVTSSSTEPIIFKANGNRIYSFYNNIIYNASENATFEIAGSGDYSFSNNLVYNASGASIADIASFKSLNSNGVYSDPQMLGPIPSVAEEGMDAAEAFKLLSTSPALNTGTKVTGVEYDFFGNAYKPSIGFFAGE